MPLRLENEEFLPGLFVIVEMEVETALKRQESQRFQSLILPSPQ